MWTIAQYQATAFFSLRPASATSTGGKTLLTPTPFAIRMALLDAAIRTQGLAQGQALFPQLQALQLAVRVPERIVVNNTFTRILRVKEIKTKASQKQAAIAQAIAAGNWPYQRTIAFREYVHFDGPLTLAFQGMAREALLPLLAQINYFGKRGGFMQLLDVPEECADLPTGFTPLTQALASTFPLGTLQIVDDWGDKLTFDHINSYSAKRITAGKQRIFRQVILPCRPTRSSRSYTLYERLPVEA